MFGGPGVLGAVPPVVTIVVGRGHHPEALLGPVDLALRNAQRSRIARGFGAPSIVTPAVLEDPPAENLRTFPQRCESRSTNLVSDRARRSAWCGWSQASRPKRDGPGVDRGNSQSQGTRAPQRSRNVVAEVGWRTFGPK